MKRHIPLDTLSLSIGIVPTWAHAATTTPEQRERFIAYLPTVERAQVVSYIGNHRVIRLWQATVGHSRDETWNSARRGSSQAVARMSRAINHVKRFGSDGLPARMKYVHSCYVRAYGTRLPG